MDENHELLQQIGVSSNELDRLVNIARRNGAYGAKMTGGGLGGSMVALTPGRGLQTVVAEGGGVAGGGGRVAPPPPPTLIPPH